MHAIFLAMKDDPDQTMTKGVTGTMATLGSAAISLMEIEGYLRVASLCIGCIVGLVTLYSIVTDMRRKKAKSLRGSIHKPPQSKTSSLDPHDHDRK